MSKPKPDRAGTAIVTGASGAIGAAIARGLAEQAYEVVLVVRDQQRGERAADAIRGAVPGARLRVSEVDVADRAAILGFARGFSGSLKLLVNNAARAPRQREETAAGIECQLATNVLAYEWMIEAFGEALARAAPARVVNVASYWAGDLDLEDLEFRRRRYDNDAAYRQSKQANRMLTVLEAERLGPSSVSVNVCHPGDVNSTLSNSLGFGGSATPDEGAATPLWLATSSELAQVSGGYFERKRKVSCPFARDRRSIERLHDACQRLSRAAG
jgi:NAD(P)-dependent dehydrogenase (short-subunit alcohol dehydrogenase family)